MPQTRSCDYCGTEIDQGTGTLYVKKNGETMYFCSSKCEKNAGMGRESRDQEWADRGSEE